jgi:ligand-binding SRPBCC domain-containing protein
MHKIRKTIEVKAPVQRVYDFLNEPTNLLSIWPNLVSVSNVVARAGGAHDFDWVYKMAGVQLKGHAAMEEAQPAKLSRFRNEGAVPSTFLWTYSGLDGSGTQLTLEVEYMMPGSVLGKIAEAIVARINDRDMDVLLANLKDVMEQPSGGVGAQPPAR